MVCSDEFEAVNLDTTKWNCIYGTESQYGFSGRGNYELQYYSDQEETIYLEDGKLHIRVFDMPGLQVAVPANGDFQADIFQRS
ncbi:MAG: hypothetical protein EA363_13000 [Balneolaceae bacterium]|nr:MAG: hypothetical protein EA363_13000 [Balneolaceae bacterium]